LPAINVAKFFPSIAIDKMSLPGRSSPARFGAKGPFCDNSR
jgi:hypothetical protein